MNHLADPTTLRKISAKTLSRVEKNDPELGHLAVTDWGEMRYSGQFWPTDELALSRLGDAIGRNSNLTSLSFHGRRIDQLAGSVLTNSAAFFDGLRLNSSINQLDFLKCSLTKGLGLDVLNECAENDCIITSLRLHDCILGSENNKNEPIGIALSKCKRLEKIYIAECNLHRNVLSRFTTLICLERLELGRNNLGRSGCEALAILLQEPNLNIRYLDLFGNDIDDNCAIILANGLKGNKRLQTLGLSGNPAITRHGFKAFSTSLSDPLSINDTYLSNHALRTIKISAQRQTLPACLSSLLTQNADANKSRVVTRKIFNNHPRLDIDPLMEWDLKALPLVITFLDKAANLVYGGIPSVGRRKLTVIHDFARALPLMFVQPVGRIGGKRKRGSVN